jgi:hypothetical protein
MGAFANKIALELGQSTKDVEDELATWGSRVDLLAEALKADPPLGRRGDHFDQVLERAAQGIERPYDERIGSCVAIRPSTRRAARASPA